MIQFTGDKKIVFFFILEWTAFEFQIYLRGRFPMKWKSPMLSKFENTKRFLYSLISSPQFIAQKLWRQLLVYFTKLPRWLHQTALNIPDEIHSLNNIKLFVSLSVLFVSPVCQSIWIACRLRRRITNVLWYLWPQTWRFVTKGGWVGKLDWYVTYTIKTRPKKPIAQNGKNITFFILSCSKMASRWHFMFNRVLTTSQHPPPYTAEPVTL